MPKRQRRGRKSMRTERIHPGDWSKLNLIYACEQCSHYSFSQSFCTMGYVAQHKMEDQKKAYELSGFISLCRFQEID
jgi:hypothetical protein